MKRRVPKCVLTVLLLIFLSNCIVSRSCSDASLKRLPRRQAAAQADVLLFLFSIPSLGGLYVHAWHSAASQGGERNRWGRRG